MKANMIDIAKIRAKSSFLIHKWRPYWVARKNFVHISGPKKTKLADNEIALVIVGRDVSYFISENIAHHRKMGVGHIVYIDNGSSDNSIDIVAAHDNTTVARCDLNFRTNEPYIRYWANILFLKGGWRLAIDADELLEYPGSNRFDLPALTRYLIGRGYTAVVANMLDLVPEGPLFQAPQDSFSDAIKSFTHYDLGNISAHAYHGGDMSWKFFLEQNIVSNPDIKVLFGGIRRTIFGEDCCLTKHPLFKMGPYVVPFPHPHVSTGLACADFSMLLKHYKFSDNVLARENALLRDGRVAHGETALRVEKMKQDPKIDLGKFATRKNPTVADLIEQGFLQITSRTRTDFGMN